MKGDGKEANPLWISYACWKQVDCFVLVKHDCRKQRLQCNVFLHLDARQKALDKVRREKHEKTKQCSLLW